MLIIFVDAWPYHFRPNKLQINRLRPNLGYSVNLHNEIFSGKSPDDIGFFGEYVFNREGRISKAGALIDFVLPKRFSGLLKVGLRRIFKIKVGQLNWSEIHKYKRLGTYPFLRENTSILDDFKLYVTDDLKLGLGNRDRHIIEKLKSDLISGDCVSSDNIFVSLCDLDGIGHKYGMNSPEYQDRLTLLGTWLDEIFKLYHDCGGKDYFILSDHGMMDVHSYINIVDWTKKITKDFNADVFWDSLYIAIHTENKIDDELLKEYPDIHWFDSEERLKYGITSKKFGKYIGVIADGKAFSPNKFGFKKLKAYHGYIPNPSCDYNYGIIASNRKLPPEISSMEAYDYICDALES